jgi:hypothetical protein
MSLGDMRDSRIRIQGPPSRDAESGIGSRGAERLEV